MASTIRIKRSSTTGNPSILAVGELAYSALEGTQSNGGDRLYIGAPGTETNGNATGGHIVIGGKYFTDMLDHVTGTLTASSAIVVDADKKIDDLYVDNIQINGNTISTTDTNGNLILNPNGSGTVKIANAWSLPRSAGTDTYILTSDGAGGSSWSAPAASSFTITGDTGSDTFSTGQTLTFTGTDPIDTAITDNVVTISIKDASTSVKGAASFSSSFFSVTSGAVSIKSGGVSNTELANSSVTINGTSISLGDVSTITANTANSITFNTTGGAAAGVTFNGSAAKTIDYSTVGAAPAAGSSSITTVGTITSGTWNGTAIANSYLANSSVTINGTSVSLGGSATVTADASTLTGSSLNSTVTSSSLTSVGTITSGTWNGTTIAVAHGGTGTTTGSITGTGALTFTAGGSNTNVNLVPQGTGTVDVGGKKVTSVGTPQSDTDAATKGYVDTVAQGLHVHGPVAAATTDTLSALTSNGTVNYSNGTNGVGATLSLQNALYTLDGYTLQPNDRILVKNQSSQFQNGIYVWDSSGTLLTRATDSDQAADNAGGDFCFVVHGSLYGDTGWVQTEKVVTMGSSSIIFNQFSGAGTYTAGDGLTSSGTTFNVVGTSNRISVTADAVDIASTYVGQSSITTVGTITSGTWNGTAISNSYLANSSVTVNGSAISLGGSATVTANTTNAITFNTTGGAAAGTTFDGSAAKTIDYSTVGASPVAGSSSIATVGTITSGTWNGTAIASGYGGTGFTTYATGDMIYASSANTLSKLAAGADGKILQMNSSGVPVWGDIDGGTY